MSKKGQALIEFILIMPVMVYLILVFVDFSLILSTKNKLDNNVSNLVMEYKETGLCPSEALCEFSDKYENSVDMTDTSEKYYALDNLYRNLNEDEKPLGYVGHSLSVSDIIILKKDLLQIFKLRK